VEGNQSIRKALRLLQAVSAHPDGLNTSELGRLTSLPRPTAGRLAATLANLGLLYRRETDDAYVLGPELARLGQAVDLDGILMSAARGPLEAVLRACNETINLTVPRRTYLDVIMQLDSPRYAMGPNFIGRAVPLHASSAGKVFLACLASSDADALLMFPAERFTDRTVVERQPVLDEIERARNQQYGLSLDEIEVGLTTVSVPVLYTSGQLLAIVSVSGPTVRLPPDARSAAVEALRQCALEISRQFPPRA
jgi:IclR family acetate operon transcriptional repressor